jgi:hypothetical protein
MVREVNQKFQVVWNFNPSFVSTNTDPGVKYQGFI